MYTHPEVAWVGKTEEDLKAEGIQYKVNYYFYPWHFIKFLYNFYFRLVASHSWLIQEQRLLTILMVLSKFSHAKTLIRFLAVTLLVQMLVRTKLESDSVLF